MIDKLIRAAQTLKAKGFYKEAQDVDMMIVKVAELMQPLQSQESSNRTADALDLTRFAPSPKQTEKPKLINPVFQNSNTVPHDLFKKILPAPKQSDINPNALFAPQQINF